MRLVYSLGIQFYSFVVLILSLFNKKAKDMIEGRKEVPKRSDSENEDLIWIHAASLGEFEQGRPIIEQIKKDYPNIILCSPQYFSQSVVPTISTAVWILSLEEQYLQTIG